MLLLQLVEREAAALGHVERLGQHVGGERPRQAQPGAQVPFGVELRLAAALGQRPAGADRGHHVVQRLARSHVHEDVSDPSLVAQPNLGHETSSSDNRALLTFVLPMAP